MLYFSSMPTWDSIHPLVIHFPIVLLLLCPLFVLISAALPSSKCHPYMISSLIMLFLGTCSLYVAASTGESAAELAGRGGAINAVLKTHEHLASESQVIFSGLSVLLAGIFGLPLLLRRPESRLSSTVMPLAFLALYLVGIAFLVNTAHAGGRLVHEFGVHALMPPANEQRSESSVKD